MTPDRNQQPNFKLRQARLVSSMSAADLKLIALNPGPSLVYLTGLHFHLSERPVIALFAPHTPPILVMPELESIKAKSVSFPVQVFLYGEDPATWPGVFHQAVLAAQIRSTKVGVEPTRLRYLELNLLQNAAPEAQFLPAEDVVADLRMHKDDFEIDCMRRAVDFAQKALEATLPFIKPGITEKQIASELTINLFKAGSDTEFPFTPIVSGGPNGANPHATPSERALQSGDLLVIDWGAMYNGYASDLTRTFAIGKIEPEFEKIHEIVLQANTAARMVARPGISAGEVDLAARHVIEKAGYGEFFVHRTGHGLGMEGHEPPYIRSGSNQVLKAGMTFTIEPGIYLPERGGVRIEDDMVIVSDKAESLSTFPRELMQL
ncbi:MAG TPA: Xaa-Pro peptidase family protein [Anaerolineales bacterium]|nr:Xaa-Pro peptidase family protein [Anaerolineales bacterium]